ncbi:gamma-glutamyltransferase [Thalassotalea maritima]|uniref:gamma-glutamyltransferase n=1 Tax=Thalassotalea maritima TaxID=3242416 RepID=UPI0035283337
MKFIKISVSIIVLLAFAVFLLAYSFRLGIGTPNDTYQAQPVYSPNGAIATSQPLASQAGMRVLQNGGNAVDAAVAAAAVLSVVEPYMTGIGGDMFAILWSEADQKLIGINGSGYAGSLMNKEVFGDRSKVDDEGALSITLPGALGGWAKLLEEHGTITLSEALQPAIELAANGFPISEITAKEWDMFTGKLAYDEGARKTFLIDNERAPMPGEWFVNQDYASTLKLIADQGIGVLYGGSLGNKIAVRIQELGGFITEDDFANYQAQWIEPVSVEYQGYRVWELPPNGQGIAALEMLKLLEPYDLKAMGHNSVDYLHHLIEAKKLAYANLEYYVGDPEFMQVTPEKLLSDEVIEKRRLLINSEQASARVNPDKSLTTTETTYISVTDNQGNMVSFINSLAGSFGSGVVVPGTGFALQNRAVGLSMKPNRANTVAPGRRPFHTIIPGFVTKIGTDGKDTPWLSFGIVGGAQQPQAHVQLLLNLMLFDMNLQEAIDAPRFRHWQDNQVSFESSISEDVVDGLRSMGHAPQNPFMATAQSVFLGNNRGLIFGGGQAVMKLDKGYMAASDSRRDRAAAGY